MKEALDTLFLNKKIIIFGTGGLSKEVILGLHSYVSYFVDNNSQKWGSYLFEKQIMNPTEIINEDRDSLFIVIASSFTDAITEQLIEMGFINHVHFKTWYELKLEIFQDLEGILSGNEQGRFPYITEITAFNKSGCKFELHSKIEEDRVVHLADEEEFITLMLDEIEEDDIFFDIGSCVGLIAIHAAQSSKCVVAFEPDPVYNRILRDNIQLNQLENKIKVVDWVVSNKSGDIAFFTEGTDSNKSPSITNFGNRGSVMLRSKSIDDALNEMEIPSPTVMKIDIEGAEILALEGMAKLLSSSKAPRCIFIELHPKFLAQLESSVVECISIIESFGYKKEYINVRHGQLHCKFKK